MDVGNLFNVKDKVVLITGGGSGIGLALAEGFAAAGSNVVIADINFSKYEETVSEEDKRKIMPVQVDITKAEDRQRMVDSVMERYGRIDVFCNNAGVNVRKNAEDVTEQDWDKVMDVNLKAMFFCAQAVGKVMLSQGSGKIINTASVSSFLGHPQRAPYASSKGGVAQMTKVLAVEWSGKGLYVNAIAPGFVQTPLTANLLADSKTADNLLSKIPLGRFAVPQDFIGPALFLASDASNYITGQILLVDGGRTAD